MIVVWDDDEAEIAEIIGGLRSQGTDTRAVEVMRLPSFSGHPICTDLVSVREDVHCESTAQEVHAGVPA